MSARRVRLVLAVVAAVLLQSAGAADAVLTTSSSTPTTQAVADANIVKPVDSSLTTYAGKAEETSDTSRAPVSVEVSFP